MEQRQLVSLKTVLFVCAGALLLLGLAGRWLELEDQVEEIPRELEKLQGAWDMAFSEDAGRVIEEEVVGRKPRRMVIETDHYTYDNGFFVEEGTIQIVSTQKPKTIDFAITSGPDRGKSQLGIYQLKGDYLIFCLSHPGVNNRPEAFGTAPREPQRIQFEFRRAGANSD